MKNAIRHALHTLLWSEQLDEHDPSQALIDQITADWEQFEAQVDDLPGFDPNEHFLEMLHPDDEGSVWNQIAHDFILTRNHHGAGFWDGAWAEPYGSQLTALAEQFPVVNCELGEDGTVIAL